MEIKALPKNLRTEVDASVQTDSEQKGTVFLYGLLASLVKQGPPCGQAGEDVQWI